MSEDLNTKSLGEKLHDAGVRGYQAKSVWADLPAATKAQMEKTALAFAASLSHDETANAVITDLRKRLQAAEERAEKVEGALEGLVGAISVTTGQAGRRSWSVNPTKLPRAYDTARAALKTEGA